jgi:hypothetical protein
VAIADEDVLEAGPGAAPFSRIAGVARVLGSLGLEQARLVGPTPRAGAKRRERIWVLTSHRPDFDPVAAARALEATGPRGQPELPLRALHPAAR